MSGEIIQTEIEVSTKQNKVGAVKSLKLEIENLNFSENDIERIDIVEIDSSGTDGKIQNISKIPETNYEYKNGLLVINKECQRWLIENQELEDKKEIKKIIDTGQEEKYYSSPGEQKYLITYILKNTNLQNQIIKSNIKAILTTFGKTDIQIEAKKELEYSLSEKVGNIISYKIENEKNELSKGYLYNNYNSKNQNLYDIDFKEKKILNISNAELVNEIYIEDKPNLYIDRNEIEYESNDIYYKKLSIPKENFNTILGETGEVQILRSDGSLVARINRESEENGIYLYNFDSKEKDINIKISKPITEGNLELEVIKQKTNSKYNKQTYKEFEYIVSKSSMNVKYENIETEDTEDCETKIHLTDTILNPKLEVSVNPISTFAQSLVEMRIKLNNNNIESDVYGNTVFRIEFPEYVKEFDIDNYNIVNGSGLELEKVESIKLDSGRLALVVKTKGCQNSLSLNTFLDGTNIIINIKIDTSRQLKNLNEDILFTFENQEPENIIFDSGGDLLNEKNVNSEENQKLVNKNALKGSVWIDDNQNGVRDKEEVQNVKSEVFLLDSQNNTIINTTKTDLNGNYEFNDILDGNYVVLFDYNSDEFTLSNYKSSRDKPENNSDVISTKLNYNGKEIDGAVTEIIKLENAKTENVNMGLIQKNIFDLELKKGISKIIVNNKSGKKEIIFNNTELAKTELPEKYISSSIIDIVYNVTIENKGNVDGYAKNIVDYIPDELVFDKTKNSSWYEDNGKLYSRALSTTKIAKGEKKEVNLILTLEMTDGNTKLINNTAEIAEDYNEYGLEDINSNPMNKLNEENDFGSADIIISVKTGGKFIYTSVLLTTTMLGGIIVFIVISKLRIKNRKEGGV